MTEPLFFSIRMRVHQGGTHLSGAEDLVPAGEIERVLASFSKRLLAFSDHHHRPFPQQVLTVDPIASSAILRKALLPIQLLDSSTPEMTQTYLKTLLEEMFPTRSAQMILEIFQRNVLDSPPRHGATLVSLSGERLLQEGTEGVRTTHVGCTFGLRSALEQTLNPPIQSPHYRLIDALILASKVLSSGSVLLEICASDDPDYTTGYIASPPFGYIRIPHMKKKGSNRGGRLYVADPDSNLPDLLHFLRNVPVLFETQIDEESVREHSLLTKIPSVIPVTSPGSSDGRSS